MPAMPALRRPSLFAIACIAVLLAAVPPVFAQAGASQDRPVAGFEAVALEAPIELRLRQTGREALTLVGDAQQLALVETVVESRRGRPTLVLRLRRGAVLRAPVTLLAQLEAAKIEALANAGPGRLRAESVQAPRLVLAVAGSGDLELGRVVADELTLAVAGSGDVRAAGTAGRASVTIAGSGDVDLGAVDADEVEVAVAGSGNAEVTAHKALSVSIVGSGDVRYGGRVAAVKTSVVGSGSVQRR